ncbi:MAG: type II toxin-antitoxin system RelE/ParE family toxin [Deltaproteobacteria bacterium]|nr:type II toxin-antitoxin system RelE/ParE family toxin [Deltaproteobacteria bacterium]
MSYKLKFFKTAYKEWQKLDAHVRKQFKSHLKKRLQNPRVESARLKGYSSLYKIKLRSVGYRLAYLVEDEEVVVYIVCVARRDKIYEILHQRLKK